MLNSVILKRCGHGKIRTVAFHQPSSEEVSPMLYKFKSPVAADVIMLQPNAEELLKIIGKTPGATGIVTAAQAPAAIAALRTEIARREAKGAPAPGSETTNDEDQIISLRHRATPFIDLLERSSAEGKDVVWGV